MPRLKDYRHPREIIAYAVWTYHRFALSTGDVLFYMTTDTRLVNAGIGTSSSLLQDKRLLCFRAFSSLEKQTRNSGFKRSSFKGLNSGKKHCSNFPNWVGSVEKFMSAS